jgi:hypothetical protein
MTHQFEEQMPPSYFPADDARQVSSASKEFQDLVESLDDAPSQQRLSRRSRRNREARNPKYRSPAPS